MKSGADGKADDTATNAPKGYYMKYDANKGTFVNISADGAVPAAGTTPVTAKSLKLSSVLKTKFTTNNADGTKESILRTSM